MITADYGTDDNQIKREVGVISLAAFLNPESSLQLGIRENCLRPDRDAMAAAGIGEHGQQRVPLLALGADPALNGHSTAPAAQKSEILIKPE